MGFWDDVNKNADKMWEYEQLTGSNCGSNRSRKGWGQYRRTIFDNDRIYKAFIIGIIVFVVFTYICKLIY